MNQGDILDGRYEIIQRLGAGGMGEVYKAKHILLGAIRVIKVVHPNISTNTDARERFLREARAATRVQHPNVATVHDFASLPDGSHYMVWEFIDGENLAQRLRKSGPLPPRAAVRIGIQALHGLDAIHRAGIIHRDISPENLMISHADDSVKIIDLGVAKVEEDATAVSQTKTGIFVGKLRYASPEQLGFLPEGQKVDGRADLYAMAMVIVELLTGRPPYEATSPHEYFIFHARDATLNTVELPRELPGSAALKESMEKALSRDRNARYATAGEFAAALEAIEKTLPDPRVMATMALPLDGDETMRVPPKDLEALQRTTVRTDAPAEPTILTPLPASPVPATIEEDVGTPPPPPPPPPAPTPAAAAAAVPAPKTRSGISPVWIVLVILFAGMLTGAVLLYPRVKRSILQFRTTSTTGTSTTTTTQSPTTSTGTPQIAETAVTVTTATTDTAPAKIVELTDTSHTDTTSKGTVVETPPPPPHEETKPVLRDEDADEDAGPATFVEGGDSGRNRRALNRLRRQLHGVTQLAVHGTGDSRTSFPRAMRLFLPDVEFTEDADFTIRYDGTGKGRNGVASVSKGDRVIFRYDSVYGASPESFARIIADAVQ